jgi:hypothetical protein
MGQDGGGGGFREETLSLQGHVFHRGRRCAGRVGQLGRAWSWSPGGLLGYEVARAEGGRWALGLGGLKCWKRIKEWFFKFW